VSAAVILYPHTCDTNLLTLVVTATEATSVNVILEDFLTPPHITVILLRRKLH